ncbi:hypothetical protein E4U25_001640 [Claviceps purpurea]|nr:hypothetical protein E4U10_006779 [Claviceps purpurea]KAG6228435.1 hypothetical protein E4U26_001010 [Claviceps purpurea]KAG6238553.1 hypothetical protein E4U25_001640 [Claviceps purpurea]
MPPPTEIADTLRDITVSVIVDDVSRGRKRSRSLSRTTRPKSLQPDESSTFRGRSPRRATSPIQLHSRNASPTSLRPSTSQLVLYCQLRRARREHCPSRTASPTGRAVRRRQRARSRSHKPRRDHEPVHSPDVLSLLRIEVFPGEVQDSTASIRS